MLQRLEAWLIGRKDRKEAEHLTRVSDAVSRRLINIAVLLLIAVVLSQMLLQSDSVRQWVTGVDRMEGRAYK